MAVAHAAGAEGQVVAAGLMVHPAIGIPDPYVEAVAERILLHQQPALFVRVAVDDGGMEPERPGLEAEGGVAPRNRLEPSGALMADDIGVAIGGADVVA